jgi:hypothetical protein
MAMVAHRHRPARRDQRFQILQDVAIGCAGVLPVARRVQHLQIVEDEIGESSDAQHAIARRRAAGLDGGVYAPLAAGAQQRFQQFRLCERLAAGEGDAAAGFIEEHHVALDLRQDLGHRHGASGHGAGLGAAGIHAGGAKLAIVRDGHAFGHAHDGAVGAGGHAIAA